MAAGVKLPRGSTGEKQGKSANRVIHLYGLTAPLGAAPELARKLTGVDGTAEVEAVACGRFMCWISRVPHAEFAQDLAKNMQDLDWLAAATTRHQQVLSAIAGSADVLPARFGIEFLNEKSLREHVERRGAALQADLERIRGKEEWGVKVFAMPPAVSRSSRKIRTGKEYLQAKSAMVQRALRPPGPEFDEFDKALGSVATEVAEGGKLAAARRDLQFHKTLLVERSERKKLVNVVRAFSKRWKGKSRIECTGPWPAFSFVSHSDSF